MSIAYLDPGNIESDLQSGSVAQYRYRYLNYGIKQRLLFCLGCGSIENTETLCFGLEAQQPILISVVSN
jgi:hypothetical protein